jgi:hypothetical protein
VAAGWFGIKRPADRPDAVRIPQHPAGGPDCGKERGLSSGLIHRRPAAFTTVRADRIAAGGERPETSVNGGQQCWKACWVQALAGSNPASSATLTCKNTQ